MNLGSEYKIELTRSLQGKNGIVDSTLTITERLFGESRDEAVAKFEETLPEAFPGFRLLSITSAKSAK